MKIEQILPPPELCKKIPTSEFASSVFVWVHDSFNLYPAARETVPGDYPGYIYPAPTLQEIMAEIGTIGGYCPTAYLLNDQWTVEYQIDIVDGLNDLVEQADLDNPTVAALKLWFNMKGLSKVQAEKSNEEV